MKNDLQKEAFLQYEANAWFLRNKEILNKYRIEEDQILNLIKAYNLQPKNILEIGCSAGYRLNGLKTVFPNAVIEGVEPSSAAIEYGISVYPEVKFNEGTVDDLSTFKDESFDLVIVGFVFYVVDRRLLLRSIAEIDRVLKNNGHLVILDFFSETTLKRNYHHINDFSAYSFKQNYDEVFSSTHLYHLINKSCYNHNSHKLDAESDFQRLYSISLLKKDLYVTYK